MLAAVVVTHNSEQVLPRCLETLGNQTRPVDHIVLVDSGSTDTAYLAPYADSPAVTLLLAPNIGFSAANNLGLSKVIDATDFILLLNPDTFLDQGFVARALETIDQQPEIGILSGKLLWYDARAGEATDRFDSTGVFRRWYGRWHDRGQQERDTGRFDVPDEVPAVCGALMLCRGDALREVRLSGGAVFDPDFFMYKEDIELCLRLRKRGWRIFYQPAAIAWHARGWARRRKEMPRRLRKMAAANEVLLYRKHPSPYIVWALGKYFLVSVFNL